MLTFTLTLASTVVLAQQPASLEAQVTSPVQLVTVLQGGAGSFGNALSLSRGTLAVGDQDSGLMGPNAGAVHLFRRSAGTWVLEQLLLPPAGGLLFGRLLSLSGDTLGVQVFDGDWAYPEVHVFRRGPQGWGLEAVVDGFELNGFGPSIAIDVDTLAIGSVGPCSKFFCDPVEALYVHERDLDGPGAWGRSAAIYSPITTGNGCTLFGNSVRLVGDVLATHAPGINAMCFPLDVVSIYQRQPVGSGSWGPAVELSSLKKGEVLNGPFDLVGTPGGDLLAAAWSPAVQHGVDVFLRPPGATQWQPLSVVALALSNPVVAVALSRDFLAVGRDRTPTSGRRVEVFARDLGGPDAFGGLAVLIPEDPPQSTFHVGYGSKLALERRTLAVGADYYDAQGGAVFIYALP